MDKNYKSTIQLNVLRKEYERRCTTLDKYSLRKFAEDCFVDPAIMNKYFNGKRKLTEEAFNQILQRIRNDSKIFESYESELQKYTLLGEKHHKIKSHWYYHGILESILLYNFEPTAAWISKKIGLSESETQIAIEELISTGILRIEEGKFINAIGDTTFIEDLNMDVSAGRNYQKELIDLAIKSIDSKPGELKDHTSLCIAFDSTLIFEIKKKIDDFKRELDHYIQGHSTQCDEIYTLQINFNTVNFPQETNLTKT